MEMASRWLSNYSFSGALSSYLLDSFSSYVTEQTTVAIDFSDISKEFGGAGMEGIGFKGLVYSEFGRLLTVPRTSVRIDKTLGFETLGFGGKRVYGVLSRDCVTVCSAYAVNALRMIRPFCWTPLYTFST